MLKRIICLSLSGTLLLSVPAFAGGPIAESAQRFSQASAQQTPVRPAPSGEPLFWSGLALVGAGATLEILSYTALKTETIVGCGLFLCTQTSTNRGVMAAGAAIAVTGIVMETIGWKQMHPMIAIGPHPSVGVRVGF